MSRPAVAMSVLIAAVLAGGCESAPGRRHLDAAVAPNTVVDFAVLYRANCAGCHGLEGRGGAALALADPIYLAVAADGVIRRATADGVPGTAMPAFAIRSGGMLTDAQVDAIVNGMRTGWAKAGAGPGIDLPPYADEGGGDAQRGGQTFTTFCASCHGDRGQGGRASSIVEGSYLALVSDQGLRTTVIAGRPELGAPDWRGDMPGRPMTPREISDVVAWLSSQRAPFPGRTP